MSEAFFPSNKKVKPAAEQKRTLSALIKQFTELDNTITYDIVWRIVTDINAIPEQVCFDG